MPKFSEKYPDGIPVELTEKQYDAIAEFAELSGRSFDDVADEVINTCLAQALPGIMAERLRKQ